MAFVGAARTCLALTLPEPISTRPPKISYVAAQGYHSQEPNRNQRLKCKRSGRSTSFAKWREKDAIGEGLCAGGEVE